jgi:hypothetical protein
MQIAGPAGHALDNQPADVHLNFEAKQFKKRESFPEHGHLPAQGPFAAETPWIFPLSEYLQ